MSAVRDPAQSSPARLTVDDLLRDARRLLKRVRPATAHRAARDGASLVDIRDERQIYEDGAIPGALVIPRNVLEWRLDPTCRHRHPKAPGLEHLVVVICDQGYQSSLAAATLQRLGFTRATDVIGGFQAWRAAGLPIEASGASAPAPRRAVSPRPHPQDSA